VFVFVRKRSNDVLALGCAGLLLLTVFFGRYAAEARPYSLLVACVALALVCYERVPKAGWVVGMEASLAAATAFHYYAVFALVPFAAAETALWWQTRRARACVWIALACGVAPLGIFWPLLAKIRAYFGPHFWAQPTWGVTRDTYGWFFGASYGASGKILTAILAGALIAAAAVVLRGGTRQRLTGSALLAEDVLVAALLMLPVIIFLAAKVAQGGMTARYALPAVLGFPLAAAYLIQYLTGRWNRAGPAAFAALVLLCVGRQETRFWDSQRAHGARFVSPAAAAVEMVAGSGNEDLPVVISDGLDYLPIVHYAPAGWAKRFVALVDERRAIQETGSDSLDKGLLAVRSCMPAEVYEYRDFVAQHPKFLLYSDGNLDFDWWPRRLMHDGQGLQILAVSGRRNLYLVDLVSGGSD
jgi:hypothetical protein